MFRLFRVLIVFKQIIYQEREMKKLLITVCMAVTSMAVLAQSGTNSPYSQYGLGVLGEQSGGFNRGMNGLGIGFHEHNQINTSNPASYASIDSLSFIFDAGIAGQITNFSENGVKLNANNANFEYVTAGFRLAKHLGVSFGVLPFSNIGYSYSNTGNRIVDDLRECLLWYGRSSSGVFGIWLDAV